MIDLLRTGFLDIERMLTSAIPFAIRSGNYKVAGYIVKNALKQGSFYGFNNLQTNYLKFNRIKIKDN